MHFCEREVRKMNLKCPIRPLLLPSSQVCLLPERDAHNREKEFSQNIREMQSYDVGEGLSTLRIYKSPPKLSLICFLKQVFARNGFDSTGLIRKIENHFHLSSIFIF